MSRTIRVGIVGCGGIARAHVNGYKAEKVQFVGMTDVNREAACKLAEELNHVPVYDDYRELIEKAKPEVVSICSPPVAHEAVARYALEHGVHVLCEKPMAFDAAAARRMEVAANKAAAQLMPAFRHRFIPGNLLLRKIVASGKIGDVVFFNNIFCGPAFGIEHKWFTKRKIAGGGCLLDTNSHSVDLFRFIVGEVIGQKAVMHRHFQTTDVEDAGVLIVKANNGAIGTMQSSFVAGVGLAFIDIIGTKGRVRFEYGNHVLYRLTKDKDWTVKPVKASGGWLEQIRHFLEAVKGKHPLSCTVHDGVRDIEIITAVYGKGGRYKT
ncbi:MAG: Gfo/Idh/MocA family oxidoreductase [Verrucomicrobiota bacterium]